MGILSSLFGSDKLEEAAKVQQQGITQATQAAQPLLEEGFGQAQTALAPFQQAAPIGVQSLQRAQTLLGLSGTPEEQQAALQGLQSSPLQQFRQSEAERALNRTAASTGLTGSGALNRQQAEIAARIAAQGGQEQIQNLLGLAGASFAPSLPAAQQSAGLSTARGSTLADLESNAILGKSGVQAGLLQNQAQQQSGLASGLFRLAGSAGGSVLGPAGTAIGNKVGGYVGNLF